MQTIWKFAIPPGGGYVYMPRGGVVLTVQAQNDSPYMWAQVDPAAPSEPRQFFIYGTGHHLQEPPGKYIGTFQLMNGALVFHVFEKER